MLTVADQPQYMKALYKHLPKVYSLENIILTQEKIWSFNDVGKDQGKGIGKITQWIKGKSLVAIRNDLL